MKGTAEVLWEEDKVPFQINLEAPVLWVCELATVKSRKELGSRDCAIRAEKERISEHWEINKFKLDLIKLEQGILTKD